MKRRLFATILSVSTIIALIGNVSATDTLAMSTMDCETAIRHFSALSNEATYGGMYYDSNGNLVINVVDSASVGTADYPIMTLSNSNIEYRVVSHSLSDLEEVKEFLTPYMAEFNILVLDANEITNQVDISLQEYSDKTISCIEDLIETSYPGIPLNFINLSGSSLNSTVAYEKPVNYNEAASTRSTTVIPGIYIEINNGYYTLGPITSSSTAYTAGHNYSGPQTVYIENGTILRTPIGSVSGYCGGSYGDWGIISLSNCTPAITHSLRDTIAGQEVFMSGANSGKQSGEVLGTNQTVSIPGAYQPLTGMYSANYRCALGDSGAGVFDEDTTKRYAYGIQSSGLFDSNGNWSGLSFFTPCSKFR